MVLENGAIYHQPYSPDLAPCDFWLVPKFKKCLEGTKIFDIQRN
jgi:hypothetical protein